MIQGIKTRGLEKYFLISPVHLSTLSKLKKKKLQPNPVSLPLHYHYPTTTISSWWLPWKCKCLETVSLLPCNSVMAQFTSFQTFLNAGLNFGDYILIILHIKSPPAKLRPPGFIKCQNKTITHILFIHYHEEKFTLCLTKYHNTSRLFFSPSLVFFPAVCNSDVWTSLLGISQARAPQLWTL